MVSLIDDGLGVVPRVSGERETKVTLRSISPGVVEALASASDGLPHLVIEVDLAESVGYWCPGERTRALPADWMPPMSASLINSAPLGALYTASDEVLLGWAADELVDEMSIRAGVSEEGKSFVVRISPSRPLAADLTVLIDWSRGALAETTARLVEWLSERCEAPVLIPPKIARDPVYSTWYTFTREIDAELVLTEARLAAGLGCRSVFIDDGWQALAHGRSYRGCGDWVPDLKKFPHLAGTIAQLRDGRLNAGLWVAPLLLGEDSRAYGELRRFAPVRSAELDCHVLDPRHSEVRDHVVATCVRLVRDYGVGVLKIDFLDQAMLYSERPSSSDLADVGQAVARMLRDLREALDVFAQADVVFEFRQPYVGPAMARYGQILRANDCPGDAVTNRRSVIDARLASVGQVVHSDPLMWGHEGGEAAVAQQFYGAWFSVPQVSMRLSQLSVVQTDAVRGLLALWADLSSITLHGQLELHGAEHGYLVVSATRHDLQRRVVVNYAGLPIDLDTVAVHETTLINASAASSMVIRTSRPVLGGVIRTASAVISASIDETDAGLIDIAVPPFGSITIRTGLPVPAAGHGAN